MECDDVVKFTHDQATQKERHILIPLISKINHDKIVVILCANAEHCIFSMH